MLAHVDFPDGDAEDEGEGGDGGDVLLQPGRPRGNGRPGTVVIEYAGSEMPAVVFVSRETGHELAVHMGDQHPAEVGISEARDGTLYVRFGSGPTRVYSKCGDTWLMPG
jgi:hypothetical protein